MKITTTRRISQAFFITLFLWLAVVATVGTEWWQLRGWPVNLFLQMDPLVALGTLLASGTLYAGLGLALATVVLTIIFGRFFCGWVCPFGTMHHFAGWLFHRKKPAAERIRLNAYRPAQKFKYYVLLFFLAAAALPIMGSGLLTGLLDPIPLVSRSVNLLLLPLADIPARGLYVGQRWYEDALPVFVVFFVAIGLNAFIPRFFCRVVCPLGALFGIIDRFAIWRIGRTEAKCRNCRLCERSCEGACTPATTVRIAECVLCMNCLDDCADGQVTYSTRRSAAGEVVSPDISRRGFVLSVAGGALALPALRLADAVGANYDHRLIRPPGSLTEGQFLERCIKCGQCMRICPTNVVQPAGLQHGLESLWTPKMNYRIGSSGCQYNCVACGHICPTAAIRPISLDEKHGTGEFTQKGPIRIGTAFVDRSRCLPWAMGRPCIVCQENCPISPKAIYAIDHYQSVRSDEPMTIAAASETTAILAGAALKPFEVATGDYYLSIRESGEKKRIATNTADMLTFEGQEVWEKPARPGTPVEILVRLQRPYVDISLCVGCGICERECPVSGLRGIRVTAEGETRNARSRLGLGEA